MNAITAPEDRCNACSAALRASAKFCGSCGAARGASAPPARPENTRKATPINADAWDHVRPLLWLYLAYFGSSLMLGFATRASASTWLTHCFEGLNAVITIGFCLAYFRDLKEVLRPRLPTLSGVALFLGVGSAFILLASGVFISMAASGVPFSSNSAAYIAEGQAPWVMFAAVSLSPALWEELAFRGVIQTRLSQVLTEKESWLVQAGLFSVLHLSPVIFVTHFGMGLMFGWLRNHFKSIYPGMLLHASWNAVVLQGELSGFSSALLG